MFKLYLNKGTRTQIDEQYDEYEIIKTMGDYLKNDTEERFMIVEYKDKIPDVKLVNGLLEYTLYVENYNERLKEKSCVELKTDMMQKVKRLTK